MITAELIRNSPAGGLVAFTVKNHGESFACAAVSMFVLNTINSIEAFTEDNYKYDYNEEGGYITFALTEPETRSAGVHILLRSMELGLHSAMQEYPNEIEIKEIKP
jgi:uncharacterized protein YsxB (DUF464 family)